MTRPLHVLFLAPLYAPYVGGAETHVRALAEAMVRLGHSVTVVTDQGHLELPTHETHGGVRVIRTGSGVRPDLRPDEVRWEVGLFGVLRELESLLDSVGPPDVVHAQCQISFLLGAVLKEHLDRPLVVTAHETLPEDDGLGHARSRVLFGLPQIDRFVAGSGTFAAQARDLGVSEVTVVESPVPRRSPKRAADLPPGDPWVLSVGRFKRRKNQLALIDAVSLLRGRDKPVRCVLVGSCDAGSTAYRDALLARVADIGLQDEVEVRENVDDGELAWMMRAADLVVQPALAEGLGLVAVEALLQGATVLATPTLGGREVLGDFPLLLTRDRTPSAIANSIEDAFERPTAYALEASRAREWARVQFDPITNASKLVSVYRQLIPAAP